MLALVEVADWEKCGTLTDMQGPPHHMPYPSMGVHSGTSCSVCGKGTNAWEVGGEHTLGWNGTRLYLTLKGSAPVPLTHLNP